MAIVIIVIIIGAVASGAYYFYAFNAKAGPSISTTLGSTSSGLSSTTISQPGSSSSSTGTSQTLSSSSSSSSKSQAPIGYVKYTFDLCTQALEPGIVPGYNGGSGCFLEPESVMYDNANGMIYVSYAANITAINGASNSFGSFVTGVFTPEQMAYDPVNNYIYVSNSGSSTDANLNHISSVGVVNAATGQSVENITVANGGQNQIQQWGIAFDPSNGYVYVASFYGSSDNYGTSGNISVIDTSTNTVIKTITGFANCPEQVVCSPSAVFYDPADGYIYVGHLDGVANVTLVQGTSVVKSISLNSTNYVGGGSQWAFAYDNKSGVIYAADRQSATISVIGATNNTLIEDIGSMHFNINTGQITYTGGEYNGSSPEGLAYDAANNYLYVTNFDSNNVTVINCATNTIIGTIAVGSLPRGIAYDPVNGYIYVANHFSDTVSIISTAPNGT
ncbi:MAG: YncE family protein [Nitrososphaerales archaeon]